MFEILKTDSKYLTLIILNTHTLHSKYSLTLKTLLKTLTLLKALNSHSRDLMPFKTL